MTPSTTPDYYLNYYDLSAQGIETLAKLQAAITYAGIVAKGELPNPADTLQNVTAATALLKRYQQTYGDRLQVVTLMRPFKQYEAAATVSKAKESLIGYAAFVDNGDSVTLLETHAHDLAGAKEMLEKGYQNTYKARDYSSMSFAMLMKALS